MAIKFIYKDLDNHNFGRAVQKLTRYNFKNSFTGYNALKIWRKLKQELDACHELYMKLLKRTCKVDEKGGLVPRVDEAGKAIFNSFDPIDLDAFNEALGEHMKVSFELPCHPIKISQLEEVSLSAIEMDAVMGNILVEDEQEAQGAA